MKALKLIVISIAIAGFIFACNRTETEKVEAPSSGLTGDIRKGRALFNDPNFGNGTAKKSCNSCHPNGKGVKNAGEGREFNIMGQKQNSLEEAVNFCIKIAFKGTPIDPDGQDMKDIVSYIRSLKQ